MMKTMAHDEFEDLILQYTTHSISEADQRILLTHLESCADCRAALMEWQQIAAAVKRNVHENGQVASVSQAQRASSRLLWRGLQVAAALLIVITFGIVALQDR